jgi:hypothetical protein
MYLKYETAFEVLCECSLSLPLFSNGEFGLFTVGLCIYRECDFRCGCGLLIEVSTLMGEQ